MSRIERKSASYKLDLESFGEIKNEEELKEAILAALHVLKASNIQVFEGHSLAKYIIVAEHELPQTIYSTASNIAFLAKKSSSYVPSFCGSRESGWIIVDFQDVILDLFTAEARKRYNIEELLANRSLRVA